MFWLKIFFIFSPIVVVWTAIRPLDISPYPTALVVKHFVIRRFIHLTRDIARDATMKLRLAQRYVDMHKGSINYELGFIAAGVFERFRFMMKVYRKYSKRDPDFKMRRPPQLKTQFAFSLVRNTVNMYSRITPGRPKPKIKRRNVMTTKALARVRDEEYKKQLRMKKMEEKRANFNPDLEGIEVDLESIV